MTESQTQAAVRRVLYVATVLLLASLNQVDSQRNCLSETFHETRFDLVGSSPMGGVLSDLDHSSN